MNQVNPQLLNWFQTVDKEKKGFLTHFQLQQALRNNNGTTFDISAVKMMIDMFNKDKTGNISMQEFSTLWGYLGNWVYNILFRIFYCRGFDPKIVQTAIFIFFKH
jgi:hypothetical protein